MPDRITSYFNGGKIEDRIDEILIEQPGVVHIEAMSSIRSFMRIGEQRFWIEVQGKDLVIRKEA
jgi:hypothetical protein